MMNRVERLSKSFEEEQSIAVLTDWLKRHPEDDSARLRRAQFYMFVTKYPLAVADLQLCRKSKNMRILQGSTWALGETYEKMGREKEADQVFAAAAPLLGNQPLVLTKLCTRARKRGDGKAALQLADKLTVKDFAEGHLQKAEAYKLLNETQKAIAEYSLLISSASKKVEHMQTGSVEAYRLSKPLKIALEGRAACYDKIEKHDLAEKDRNYHRQMDQQVFDHTPFLKN